LLPSSKFILCFVAVYFVSEKLSHKDRVKRCVEETDNILTSPSNCRWFIYLILLHYTISRTYLILRSSGPLHDNGQHVWPNHVVSCKCLCFVHGHSIPLICRSSDRVDLHVFLGLPHPLLPSAGIQSRALCAGRLVAMRIVSRQSRVSSLATMSCRRLSTSVCVILFFLVTAMIFL